MHIYGLTGFPLKNSFSERFFREKFLSLGLTDHTYKNFSAETITDIEQMFTDNKGLLRGLNVTIPHKQSVLSLLDSCDESAKAAGAVNCIRIEKDGTKRGFNTDVYGFRNSIMPLLKAWHQKALVLGTGGSAKAVCHVLQKLGINYSQVSRSREKMLSYEDLDKAVIRGHQVIINCTPVGMSPDTESSPPLPYEFITDMHLVYDLIYTPDETLFLKKSREQGAVIKNGLEMLYLQAEKSWEIWQHKI